MTGEWWMFLILSFMAVSGAVLMIQLSKVIHMILALVLTFVSIAGLYFMLAAEFIAVVQLLIYSGAVTIIMLFGIMLTNKMDGSETKRRSLWKKGLVLVGVVLFAVILFIGIQPLDFGAAGALKGDNTKLIGQALYSHWIIPFELASVLLLAALVGAVVLAKKEGGANES
ncbi:NADH-quinone oxidoreductase subunit J [Falsibacillus albus]|uniref:NADH-quinone oxidoreductase subunit J n=1 Tax=Falsibacillus albus TaxID=2478915 RepID=A0A3L7JI06_9BACI|nr:NADH-quinone oxidoreductase subunit J [Falsibacillus albus]RLQ89965.1 NADH-quinone oxidoreductase subunit J [Falsibacillus albus]